MRFIRAAPIASLTAALFAFSNSAMSQTTTAGTPALATSILQINESKVTGNVSPILY